MVVWTERQPYSPVTLDLITRFYDAVNQHDLMRLSGLLARDAVFENTGPAPDGVRYQGKAEVMAYWRSWLAVNRDARFEVEDVLAAGPGCTVRWTCRQTRDGLPWHLRGVAVFATRDERIVSTRSYVKG